MPKNLRGARFRTKLRILVGSDESRVGVPEHLVRHRTQFYAIYCTSPDKSRWSRLHKTTQFRCFIMNPRRNLSNVSHSFYRCNVYLTKVSSPSSSSQGIDPKVINDIFYRLGPTPRLCVEYAFDPVNIQAYERDLTAKLGSIPADTLKLLVQDANSLTMSDISHKPCLI
jgi:hypothetical protein